MKIAKKDAAPDSLSSVGPSGGITAENYSARCSAFIKGRGNVGFVIRAIEGFDGSGNTDHPATESQWIAWMEYFARKEIPHRYARARGMTTVPSEWPDEFDYETPLPDRHARLRPLPPPMSRERRQGMGESFSKLSEAMKPRFPRSPKFNIANMSPAMAEVHVHELLKRNASDPVRASPALLKSLGLAPVTEAAE